MEPIVLQLQTESLDSRGKITDLLRKALLVARKLKVVEFRKWIELEFSGYGNAADIPKYREVTGKLLAWNSYRGFVPMVFENAGLAESLSIRQIGLPISEIENLVVLSGREKSGSRYNIDFRPEIEQQLMNSVNHGIHFKPTLEIQGATLHRIVDTVRSVVLSWALTLEGDGIKGEGISFSDKEIAKAANHTYNINNFFSTVSHSQVQ